MKEDGLFQTSVQKITQKSVKQKFIKEEKATVETRIQFKCFNLQGCGLLGRIVDNNNICDTTNGQGLFYDGLSK